MKKSLHRDTKSLLLSHTNISLAYIPLLTQWHYTQAWSPQYHIWRRHCTSICMITASYQSIYTSWTLWSRKGEKRAGDVIILESSHKNVLMKWLDKLSMGIHEHTGEEKYCKLVFSLLQTDWYQGQLMWRRLQMAFLRSRKHNKPSLALYSKAVDMDNMLHTEAAGEMVYELSSVFFSRQQSWGSQKQVLVLGVQPVPHLVGDKGITAIRINWQETCRQYSGLGALYL